MQNPNRSEPIALLPGLFRWLFLSALTGVLAGTASAWFLILLERVTDWRESHPRIIYFLPLAGFVIGLIYHYLGQRVESGNNLLLDEIHDPKKVVPFRMAPLIFLSTLATHLFGGSAGREGTAVQMGGSLADQLSIPFRLRAEDRRILLMAGVSAGFGSVFGTPVAGAVFGLEVLAVGRLRYDAIFPCFIAALVGHEAALAWGVRHTQYAVAGVPEITAFRLFQVLLAGAIFGLMGLLFSATTHGIARVSKKYVPYGPLRLFAGGAVVAGLVKLCGTTKYVGLGIPTIIDSFYGPLPPWDFAAKYAFTAITLGAGFKGGEVTPLFFIGAALGSALSYVSSLPPSLLAGLGFVAVFAGAANTPLTCTLLAMELFGAPIGVYAGIACVMSYLFSGHTGIYHSQKTGSKPFSGQHPGAGGHPPEML